MVDQEIFKNEQNDKGRKYEWGLNILVVDDNLMIQEIIELLLQSDDCHITIVGNGRQAIEELAKDFYDLILMDLQMPEMNGYEATVRIRAMEQETGEHIPILAMTGYPLENGRKNCIIAGMDDYLVKPFDVADLIAAIERLTHTKISPNGLIK
jgi:two-component system, sensor histidine kinase and response regulator